MKKVEFKNGVLYLGDCSEVVALIDTVDCVVTSPPYNLNKEHSAGGATGTAAAMRDKYEKWYFDDMPEPEYQAWQKELIHKLIAKCRGSIFYNHRIRYAWHSRNSKYRPRSHIHHPLDWLSDFPIWAEIVWDRLGAGTPTGRVNLRHEYIYQINRPAGGDLAGESSIWSISPDRERNGHVCPFPVALAARCLKIGTDPGQVVFDPFMGTGTTAVACINSGRRFIGAEIDEKTFEQSVKRITEAERQEKLF